MALTIHIYYLSLIFGQSKVIIIFKFDYIYMYWRGELVFIPPLAPHLIIAGILA